MNAVRYGRLAWLIAASGLSFALLGSLAAPLTGALYLVSTVGLGVAAIVSARIHSPRRSLWWALLVIAGCSIAGQALAAASNRSADVGAAVAFLAVEVALAFGAIVIVTRRLGSDPVSVLVDGSIVAAGSWFIIWTVFLQPSLARPDIDTAVVAVNALTLAVTSVILFTLTTLVLGDGARTPVLWLATAGIVATLVGDFLYAARDASLFGLAEHVALAPYIAATALAAATFLHPGVRTLLEPTTMTAEPHLLGRLLVTTLSLVVPLVVLATRDPVDTADRSVRTVSIVLLAVVVVARMVHTVRRNAVMQRDLVEAARSDALTGLPNRASMTGHVAAAIDVARVRDRHPAVLFIDVDRFKNINDSLGHQAGDDVLVAVARRLSHALPRRCVVGRISGDEFIVLDPDNSSPSEAVILADTILESFQEPLSLRQGDVFVSASIGVATLRAGVSTSADDLLRHADTAMYRAKDAGRNCVAVFDESMLERVTQRLAVETALYRALERRELRLVHQPIVDIDLGDVVGFEALMRWEREDGSPVSPAEFIPIAEETGTIVPIGAWALLEALTHLRGWIDEGACRRDATMSVNVSPRQLHDPNFVSVVGEALMRSGVAPDQLWLEVTEGVMIAEPEQALSALRRLCEVGVRVAIDDFGTGYSSLSLLQRFPIQRIKIDRSFVSGVADDLGSRSLVRTILAMGTSLGLDMVAEGVESVRQLQSLAELGCPKAQGFLISHPVPADSVSATVAALDRFGAWSKLRGARGGDGA